MDWKNIKIIRSKSLRQPKWDKASKADLFIAGHTKMVRMLLGFLSLEITIL